MKKINVKRLLSVLLALCLTLGVLLPAAALATEEGDGTGTGEAVITDYDTFLTTLKVLEGYADSYAATSGKNAGELVVNFIRTGVDRYNDGNWVTLAGSEITGFTTYVQEQDAAQGTNAMLLRNIEEFTLPNGQGVDFGHMFGTLNIAYVNSGSADLGGWAGDVCDLMLYSKNFGSVPAGTVEEMADYIRVYCFGVDADDAFGMDDFYGDLDAYYLNAQMKSGTSLSDAMEGYFTASLTDSDRAAFFLNNRFSGLETSEDVRGAIYDAYTANLGVTLLEGDRGLTDDNDLRTACCYAFADHLFALAGDRLEGDTGEEDGGGDEEEGGEDNGKDDSDDAIGDNAFYSVFSSTSSMLAPGVTQTTNYAYTADNKQIVYYVATVDINRDDLAIYANYSDNDPSKGWAMARVSSQMAAALKKHSDPADAENYIEHYTPILGVNADFYNMSTGKPSGALVMEGVQYNGVGSENFFAILKDGTPVIGSASEWATYADQVQEAVGGSIFLVRNGEMVVSSGSTYYENRAPRTAVGIKADGEVVLVVLDGRQEPHSAGATAAEIAQVMLDAGCVIAINLDGGGSSTFAAKAEGSDQVSVMNNPSDGYERSVSSSLVVVSTAVVSNEFHHALISTEYEYLTVGTGVTVAATGVSDSGNAAQIPENAVWQLSDSSIGTLENGVFTGVSNGDVDVQLVVDGNVVGSKTLHVVVPNEISFEKETMTAIYGVPMELTLKATYNGSPVKMNPDDYWAGSFDEDVAVIDGLTFLASEDTSIRSVTIAAVIYASEEAYAEAVVNLYRADEAVFDFDSATAGDRKLAWDREISNATTADGVIYQITDPNGGMDLTYTFALDMSKIDTPSQLEALTAYLPGGDVEGMTAWNFLLQLAERVSVLTEVRVTAQFDADLEIDYSGLKLANDYFYLKEATLDETTNTLTIVCGWVDQTASIDPETANPICILSGIKAAPKADAQWDAEDQLAITNVGNVSYKIYLRANALYSNSQNAAFQQQYELYPFENTDVIINGATEKGAYFTSAYTSFTDSFVLDSTNRQGWVQIENYLYYFVDNVPLTGVQIVPGYEDPANNYCYSFAEDGSCSGLVTGLFELDGSKYYAVKGVLRTGWQTVSTGSVINYYYFLPSTGAAVDGVQTIAGYTYTFTDCILTRGDLRTDEYGTRYRWAGYWVYDEWLNIDGNISYAGPTYYFFTGLRYFPSPEGDYRYYIFSEDGIWEQDANGLYEYNGKTYLAKDGYIVKYPGLVKVGDYYYYFNSSDVMIKDCTYWISKPNGLMPEGICVFDEEGRLVDPVLDAEPEQPDPEEPEVEVKNGFVDENGATYYYVNGVKTYAGLIQIDGAYYYVNSQYKVIKGCTYWPSKTNGLIAEGWYEFDADGKLVMDEDVTPDPDEPETEVKNGFVDENGDTYYYVNGVKTYAGLIQIDGAYYYVNSQYKVIKGRTYWISKTNGLMEEKSYTFDDEGKMVVETEPEVPEQPGEPEEPEVEVKNGFVDENGDTYYYVNGVKTYAGLIQIDGAYYYVNSQYKVIKGCTYWISKTNGLMEEKSYAFDDEGKMVVETEPEVPEEPEQPEEPEVEVKNGFVDENGVTYYYVNGVKTYAGLIQIDGKYYYVNSQCQVIKNQRYWISKTNGLAAESAYDFDADGVAAIG